MPRQPILASSPEPLTPGWLMPLTGTGKALPGQVTPGGRRGTRGDESWSACTGTGPLCLCTRPRALSTGATRKAAPPAPLGKPGGQFASCANLAPWNESASARAGEANGEIRGRCGSSSTRDQGGGRRRMPCRPASIDTGARSGPRTGRAANRACHAEPCRSHGIRHERALIRDRASAQITLIRGRRERARKAPAAAPIGGSAYVRSELTGHAWWPPSCEAPVPAAQRMRRAPSEGTASR